jgi:uncharacterized protein YbbC (DUF1343 family)
MPTLLTGLDRLVETEFAALRGLRVGLFSNPSAVDAGLRSAYHLFAEAARRGWLTLGALFGPEHGFAAAAADGAAVASGYDSATGAPIYSLYGQGYKPTPAMLADLDLIVCDIQDVGVRFYTYIWSISYLMEAAGEAGLAVLILDRPNPLGGLRIDGPLLEPGLASFVGRFPIPLQHGLTLAELAKLINAEYNPTPAPLTTLACTGWARANTWPNTGRLWVATSPNMPHPSTVMQYPGACLVEGTILSEGRGTALPFEIVGAPFIEGQRLADSLNGLGLPGVLFREHTFQPTSSKWAGQSCGGAQVHPTDSALFEPLPTWLAVIAQIRRLYADQFAWLPPYADNRYGFDKLVGDTRTRLLLEQDAPLAEITGPWAETAAIFRQQSHLYTEGYSEQ